MTSIYDDKSNIYELQVMLRKISKTNQNVKKINPDGLFKNETADAVKAVQKLTGLPVTGEVDYETWTVIVNLSKNILW